MGIPVVAIFPSVIRIHKPDIRSRDVHLGIVLIDVVDRMPWKISVFFFRSTFVVDDFRYDYPLISAEEAFRRFKNCSPKEAVINIVFDTVISEVVHVDLMEIYAEHIEKDSIDLTQEAVDPSLCHIILLAAELLGVLKMDFGIVSRMATASRITLPPVHRSQGIAAPTVK